MNFLEARLAKVVLAEQIVAHIFAPEPGHAALR